MSRIRQPALGRLLLNRASLDPGIFRTISFPIPRGELLTARLRPLVARVRLNSLFKQLSFSGDAERDSLKSSSQVRFVHHANSAFIFIGG